MQDNSYININSFIKSYDEINTDFNFNKDDLFYNEYISNYEEFSELN